MIIPVEAVKEWLSADPLWAGYGFVFAQGKWQDTAANATQRICYLGSMGGPVSRDPGVFYDSIRVTLLGPQKGGADMKPIRDIAYAIRERLVDDFKVCGAAQLKMQASPIGPHFTIEERPWMELNIEVIS